MEEIRQIAHPPTQRRAFVCVYVHCEKVVAIEVIAMT